MCRTLRRCVALVAAYAVALQLLLTGFAAAPLAAAPGQAGFAICQSGDSPPSSVPHDPCAACLGGHCGGPALNPGRVTADAPVPVGSAPAEIVPRAVAHAAHPRLPQSARAPPG